MFKLCVGIAVLSIVPASVSAQQDRPCEELAIEMLAGDWAREDFLILGGELHPVHSMWRGERVGPGQVKFETAPNTYLIISYRRSAGTEQIVDSNGEPLAPPSEIVIPACARNPDTGTYYWIEEGRTGPGGELGYRKEFYASPELAIEILQVKSPEQGNDGDYVSAGSAHMTRQSGL